MSDTEIYFLGLALIGWCFAGHYYLKSRVACKAGAALLHVVVEAAEGRAKIERTRGGIKITELENEHGNTSKQDGQSEGTDRS